GDLPGDDSLVHVITGDPAIRRLDDAQALQCGQLGAATTTIVGRAKGSWSERRRGSGIARQCDHARVCRGGDIDETRFRIRGARPPVRAAAKTGQRDGSLGSVRSIRQRTWSEYRSIA